MITSCRCGLRALLAIGGLAFVARTFAWVLAPAYATGWLPVLLLPGGLSLMLWLLIKGVDVQRWEASVRGARLHDTNLTLP